MANTVTSYAEALKILYPNKKLAIKSEKMDPFLALVKKDSKFSGSEKRIPVVAAFGQNISTDYDVAYAGTQTDDYVQWELKRQKHYGIVKFENELFLANDKEGKATAMGKASGMIASTMRTMRKDLAFGVWNGYYVYSGAAHKWVDSARSYVSSVPAVGGTYTTFTVPERVDLAKFDVGMTISWAAYATPATKIDSAKIHRIDAANKTIEIVNAATTDPSQYDMLFRNGDEYTGTSTSGCGMHGIPDWIPITAPSSTAADFTGAIRGTDERLYGHYYDGSGASTVREALINGVANQGIFADSDATIIFMNSIDMAVLSNEVEGTVYRSDSYSDIIQSKKANFSFAKLSLMTDAGPITIVGSKYVPKGYAWVLNMNSWVLSNAPNSGMPGLLHHPGAVGDIFEHITGKDQWMTRSGWYGDLYTDEPNNQGVIKL